MRHIGTTVAIGIALGALAQAGCATMKSAAGMGEKVTLTAENRVPAAMGKVVINTDEDRNKQLKIEVEHLPAPEQLDPNLRTYVVWADPDKGAPVPLGRLAIEPDRSADAELSAPFDHFDLLITAEDNGEPIKPSDIVVMRGRIGSP